ncbi:Nucleotide-binding universal stress protein, UspA family [Albimonas donghaensis]|uniref:Nucleotide-binding universal stress protein, UspA family n=1 Tax=Albimonas donghaensis TaxID=356660 RepID=A0A1H3B1H3_9RHOB|nr:universal stress protein [Albimonas donghaensis]SDX34909.1 Nucleotide-binding universal stress protein, UspA family [Albimonas donghaensis]
MFAKIMVPVDLAHADKLGRALETAAGLGGFYGCPVCYVGVTTEAPSSLAHTPEEYAAKLAAFAAAQGETGGHKAESHAVASHDPSVDLDGTLIKAAEDVGADLIVMASHIPNLADHLWPSHGGQVARKSHASVLVVR